MLVNKGVSMPFLPTTVPWTYERGFLSHNDHLHHHVYGCMHLHSAAAVSAYTSSLEPSDWSRVHKHACYPRSYCRLEQLQRPHDLPVSTSNMFTNISDFLQTPCEAVTSNQDAAQAEVGAHVTSCNQSAPMHSRNAETLLR